MADSPLPVGWDRSNASGDKSFNIYGIPGIICGWKDWTFDPMLPP